MAPCFIKPFSQIAVPGRKASTQATHPTNPTPHGRNCRKVPLAPIMFLVIHGPLTLLILHPLVRGVWISSTEASRLKISSGLSAGNDTKATLLGVQHNLHCIVYCSIPLDTTTLRVSLEICPANPLSGILLPHANRPGARPKSRARRYVPHIHGPMVSC